MSFVRLDEITERIVRELTGGSLLFHCAPPPATAGVSGPPHGNRKARIRAGSYRGYQGGSAARISADDGGATVVRLRCPGNGRENRARNLN